MTKLFDKYDRLGAYHDDWYAKNVDGYRDLVDDAVRPFAGLSGSLVDIGCGDGVPLSILAAGGLVCTGVDSAPEGINIARKKRIPNTPLFCTTAELFADAALPEFTGDFDFLFSLNTIEHLDDPSALCRMMIRVKKFGVVITDIPSDRPSKYHVQEFTAHALASLFVSHDFDVETLRIRHPAYHGIIIRP